VSGAGHPNHPERTTEQTIPTSERPSLSAVNQNSTAVGPTFTGHAQALAEHSDAPAAAVS
jgi:hypothetical protein